MHRDSFDSTFVLIAYRHLADNNVVDNNRGCPPHSTAPSSRPGTIHLE
jgi:hypothetical protein